MTGPAVLPARSSRGRVPWLPPVGILGMLGSGVALLLAWSDGPVGPAMLVDPMRWAPAVLVAVAVASADPTARRGLALAVVLSVPAGLGPLADGRPVGVVLAGTIVALGALLTLPRATRSGRAVNGALLAAGVVLLLTPVAGRTWSGGLLITLLGAVSAVLVADRAATGDVARAATRPAVVGSLTAAVLVLPALTLTRSFVPDLFLAAAAERLPGDLVRLAAAVLGLGTGPDVLPAAAGMRAVATALLLFGVLLVAGVAVARSATSIALGASVGLAGAAVLLVLVIRARGGFDVAAVGTRAAELLPVVLVAPAVLAGLARPGSAGGGPVSRAATAVMLGVAHALALFGRLQEVAGPAGVATGRWVVGSVAGGVLAVGVARALLPGVAEGRP